MIPSQNELDETIYIYIYIYFFFFEEKGIKFSVTSHAIVTKLYIFSFFILDFFENRNYRSFKTIKEKKERKVRDSLTLKRTNRDNPKQCYVSARLQYFIYIYMLHESLNKALELMCFSIIETVFFKTQFFYYMNIIEFLLVIYRTKIMF